MKVKKPIPFGKALIEARVERGISQYRLAKLVNRDSRYISQLENNKREPRLSTIMMLARALDMETWELVQKVDTIMDSPKDTTN
ncbi:helix-turn-helix domain-containing protein [Desulfovibrio sp. OttesenSCG-928-C06]|nr:helix-turn-helix domain-containing protein [Desulfovibrio sp. OttesenSCG-928-C06]